MMNSAMRLLELPGFVDPLAFGGRESFGFSAFVFSVAFYSCAYGTRY